MALSKEEIEKIVALLKEEANLQSKISNSLDDYIDGLKRAKKVTEEINRLRKKEAEQLAKVNSLRASGNHTLADDEEKIYDLLKSQTDELEKHNSLLKENLKNVNKTKLLGSKALGSITKGVLKLPGLVKQGYGQIKGIGLFEMDKAVKNAALSMGVLTKESVSFTKGLRESAFNYSNQLGINLQDLAKMQADYSEELGRTVVLSDEGLKAMTQLAKGTTLGAEGAAAMAASMDTIGYSAERTRDFVEQTLDDSHKMGVNASKVLKNIQQNIKMLNKYNFKNGAKGLAKMAETTTKLGIDMNFAAGMADKLFDIEGAVDMSAQLQVMGGEWAKLADPFKLMYMARNDMNALSDSVIKAAESAAVFNKKTGEFEISGLELHRLRKIAEQTGLSYEDLAESAKKARKFSEIKSQINFSIGGTEEDKKFAEYITSKAVLGENKKATILINGQPKLLSTLTAQDKNILKLQQQEQNSLEKRAKESQTFDDKLTNLINMLKITLMPVVDGINSVLSPLVDKFMNDKDFKESMKNLGKSIGDLVVTAAEIIKSVGEFVGKYPKLSLGILGGIKLLTSGASWIANGVLLAEGFNMGTKGGSLLSVLSNKMGSGANMMNSGMKNGNLSRFGKGFGTAFKGATPLAAVGGAFSGYEEYSEQKDKGKSTSSALGRGALKGLGTFLGGAGGMALGAALAPATGGLSLLIPLIAGAAGGAAGSYLGDLDTYGVDDGIFGGTKNRAIVQGGKITPIDNKDDLLAMKPGGAVDRTINKQQVNTIKHEFGEITFNGNITLTTPGNQKLSVDLTRDPVFVREITKIIQSETEKTFNQGKNK